MTQSETLGTGQRLLAAVILTTASPLLGYIFAFTKQSEYSKFFKQGPAFTVSGYDAMIPFAVLGMFILAVAGWTTFLPFVSANFGKRCASAAIGVMGIGVFAWPIYNYALDSHLESNGYTECWEMTRTSLWTSPIWVKDPAFCIPQSDLVRHEMLEWLDQEFAAGAELTPEYVVPNLIRIRDQEHARLRKLRER